MKIRDALRIDDRVVAVEMMDLLVQRTGRLPGSAPRKGRTQPLVRLSKAFDLSCPRLTLRSSLETDLVGLDDQTELIKPLQMATKLRNLFIRQRGTDLFGKLLTNGREIGGCLAKEVEDECARLVNEVCLTGGSLEDNRNAVVPVQ